MGARRRWYFPVSTPWPSGDHTICEIPSSLLRGMTARSGRRQSSEYCGWLDTNRSTPGSACAASIWPADHSLKPR